MYDSFTRTTVGFYNQYRSLVVANTTKSGDKIKWNSQTLPADEKLGLIK